MSIKQKIIELEKEALNEWSSGNASGYSKNASADYTYTDNLGATELIVGKDKVLKYVGTAFANLPEHKYEMYQPHVQYYDDTAILGYQYHPFTLEGDPSTKWSASVVYKLMDGEWKMVHAHWTMLQGLGQ